MMNNSDVFWGLVGQYLYIIGMFVFIYKCTVWGDESRKQEEAWLQKQGDTNHDDTDVS